MTTNAIVPLTAVVTTDLAAITRGRSFAASSLEELAATGIGWLPANLSLTAFNSIVDPNPWGSSGDLRVLPDVSARYRTAATGSVTPFDMVMGNIVELDGSPWSGCTRTQLIQAAEALHRTAGLRMVASFEHEFQVFGASFPPEQALSFAALRRADPFGPQIMAALQEAGVEPEVMIAEFGADQFEVTNAPAAPVIAADRAVALREITREIARNLGWKASFAPKTALNSVGNGVHVHFSLSDDTGRPAMYDASMPAGLSQIGGAFCAGVLRHLPALTLLTAPSVASYYRLKPHSWSSSYTWLADRDREATLRICPTTTIGGRNPGKQYNIEYRAADATGNPYLALTAILRAGLAGITEQLPVPPLFDGHPTDFSEEQQRQYGLRRLPQSLEAAIEALEADAVVRSWFSDKFIETLIGVRRAEIAQLANLAPEAICDTYRKLY